MTKIRVTIKVYILTSIWLSSWGLFLYIKIWLWRKVLEFNTYLYMEERYLDFVPSIALFLLFWVRKKLFLIFLKKFFQNYANFARFLTFSEGVNFWTSKNHLRTLKIEYTFVRYVPCMGRTQAKVVKAPWPSERKRATNFYTTRIQVALGDGDNKYKG